LFPAFQVLLTLVLHHIHGISTQKNLWGKFSRRFYQNTCTMKPSFTFYQEDKWYKELPTENFFQSSKGNFVTSFAPPHCVSVRKSTSFIC